MLREGNRWVYKGAGVFKIPRLEPVKINITYDGKVLAGDAETGFSLEKAKLRKIKVNYESKPGAERPSIWGVGSLEFVRGRAKGALTVNMSERGSFPVKARSSSRSRRGSWRKRASPWTKRRRSALWAN